MTIDKEQFTHLFEEAKSRYESLRGVDVGLYFGNGSFFTMQALITPSSILGKRRKYYVQVNLKRTDIISKLSEDNILGWFGHELAHIVEYEKISNFKLSLFVFKYLLDRKFRFSTEKRVNVFAFNNGFAKELVGVYRKFISIDSISPKYKKYIVQNYCPLWEDIKEVAEGRGINKEDYESLTGI